MGLLAGGGALFKILLGGKFVLTGLSALGSFAAYAVFFRDPWLAAGIVVMIFIHEMGHVVEIRRQGMQATAPVFIPFLGAAIFQRSHPVDALRQAMIGIAGPIAGTIGATVAFILYVLGGHGFAFLLGWAWIGFAINLFNLIPIGMLDGGWILAAVSKWFQLFGLGLLAVGVFFFGLSPIFAGFILLMGYGAIKDRFVRDRSPYYQSVPTSGRLAMAAAWTGLVAYLVFFLVQVLTLIHPSQLT